MNKARLSVKFTEIVAMRLDALDQRVESVWPPNTDLDRWRRRYIGLPNLPYPFVELNHFRNEVDEFVAMLMGAIDEETQAEQQRK